MAIDPDRNVTYPAVRNSPAVADDFGIVSRVLGTVNITFAQDQPDEADVNRIPASASVVTLIPAGATNRKTVSIYNDSPNNLFVKLGAGAGLTDFTVKLAPDDFYETPVPNFIGEITGIWDSVVGGGAAQVTEEFKS